MQGRSSFIAGLLISATLMTGAAAATAADAVTDIVNRGELVVAVQTQGPPFSFVNKNGERTGFAVEVVKQIAQDMAVDLRLEDFEWRGLVPSLLAGRVDFIAADMTPTPQRALQLNFTEPYFTSNVVAYTTSRSDAVSFRDLNAPGVRVGVPQGSSHVNFARSHIPEAEIVELSGGTPAVAQALSVGRVDAGVTAFEIADQFTREFDDIRILDGVIVESPVSFPVRPEDHHLLQFLNNWFRVRKADRTIDRLLDYWVRSDAWEADHK